MDAISKNAIGLRPVFLPTNKTRGFSFKCKNFICFLRGLHMFSGGGAAYIGFLMVGYTVNWCSVSLSSPAICFSTSTDCTHAHVSTEKAPHSCLNSPRQV